MLAFYMVMKVLKWGLLAAVLIQIIPYGHTHTNPPVTQEPAWDSPATRSNWSTALATTAIANRTGLALVCSRRADGPGSSRMM